MLRTFVFQADPQLYIQVQFKKGFLQRIESNPTLQKLSYSNLQKFFALIGPTEALTMQKMAEAGFVLGNVPESQANKLLRRADLILAWQKAWHKSEGFSYDLKRDDAAKLAALSLTATEAAQLLEVYFKSSQWYARTKTIGGFAAHLNQLRRELKNPQAVSSYPPEPNQLDERVLEGKALTAYWRHYRSQGWQKDKKTGRWTKHEQ